MIYHFISSSPITNDYLSLMVDNKIEINLEDHYFILMDSGSFSWDEEILKKLQFIRIKNKWGFIPTLRKISDKDKIIIHGLFYPYLLFYLYLNRKMIKKCIWSIWGGDCYFYKHKHNSLKDNIIEFLRKVVIPQITVITTIVKGDYEIIREVYGSNATYVCSFYPNSMDFGFIEEILAKSKKIDNYGSVKTILVGNSGVTSNNHYEVFETLSKFSNENIKIICPLSYGDLHYIEKMINMGKEIFGNKFEPLIEFLPFKNYVKILSSVDIAIMNHDRQQALGNIYWLLATEKKIYLKENTTHYRWFKEHGYKINKFHEIKKCSFEELFTIDRDVLKNNAKNVRWEAKEKYSQYNCLEVWKKVFQTQM